ncbi:hypothetical protein [Paraburkholderia sp. SOS3]|uniref:hypothetical protein n=1 Tax=Paraburkholderia sp. SOS3 TaxID=1926494 RepID=UPI0009475D41|nr:hypothetical protein [Paraburkholderia sp. SOS3]APR37880.1 hypothetical protein BTO02_20145 [Paraburkholderia sp. SOS3]APR40049.1 hypothetical protein BTO02_33465 [Paraburkholderia sp. SOS3]APR40484.1 hypothetical protein BTO02_33620 [Paraburkholderia sp. SOS3]
MSVQQVHEQKETIEVDVLLPGHDPRTTTSLFRRSRAQLLERDGARCFISNKTAEELGAPLEAHHHPIERCYAEIIDWPKFAADCKRGLWGPHAAAFDWLSFLAAKPFDPYRFVDDMTVNGVLLGKQFHTAKDAGIHMLPYPIWIAQKYAREGYQFSPTEVIHHDPEHL